MGHPLEHLLRDLADAFARPVPADPKPLIDGLTESLRRMLGAGLFLDERYQRFSQEGGAGHEVYRDPAERFVVATGTWLPQQKTPIHDHGGTRIGVIAGLSGRVVVTSFRRLDDGLTTGYASLTETSRVLVTDSSFARLAPPEESIHRIENPYRDPAVTLHVFGGPAGPQSLFEPREKTVFPIEGRPELALV